MLAHVAAPHAAGRPLAARVHALSCSTRTPHAAPLARGRAHTASAAVQAAQCCRTAWRERGGGVAAARRSRRAALACRALDDDKKEPGPASSSSSSSSSGSSSQPEPPAATGTSSTTSTESNPAIEGSNAQLQVSKEVIETLRNRVFGIDTMWVTSVDNYQADGVIFKGNVRGKDPASSYAKMKQRLADVMGDSWQLFLLEDKEEKPTAVLLPSSAREGALSPVTEVWLAVVFGAATVVSSLQSAGLPLFDFLINPFYNQMTQQDVLDAAPIAGLFLLTLLIHEAGHRVAAAKHCVSLYLPLLVPAGFGFVGSFGGITRFKGFAPNRPVLLDVAMAGPLAGVAASGALLAAGLALTAAGAGDVTVDSPALADSFVVGLLGQLVLGEALASPEVQVSSLFVAGWAGLVVNCLNLLPTGELDGGRMALGLWGRRAYQAVGVLTIIALGINSFFNPLSFYWVLLVLTLQRGPLLPCCEELTPIAEPGTKNTALALLLLPLLVLLPYPVELLVAMKDLPDPTLF